MFGVIVILIVCIVAHCPTVGVKVYVVVEVLFIAGVQVPEIPLVELVGSGDIVPPEQNGPTWVNKGVMFGVIVMLIVCIVAH
jgi:hypothetical protein